MGLGFYRHVVNNIAFKASVLREAVSSDGLSDLKIALTACRCIFLPISAVKNHGVNTEMDFVQGATLVTRIHTNDGCWDMPRRDS